MDHHHPVKNSEVYLLNSTHAPSIAPPSPPSPPSPITPCERGLSPPLDDLITPFDLEENCPSHSQYLDDALHVMDTAESSLSHPRRVYSTDHIARSGFVQAVELISSHGERGKVVVIAVGKSGHVAKKMVASMNSLNVRAQFLHAAEAIHGDLGMIGPYDTILMLTFSGKTPELLALLPHLDDSLPMIVMTSHTRRSECEIIRYRPAAILLPSPIHKSETESFGVSAPTTSTTVAITLGDCLALAIANTLNPNVGAAFGKNHPGGAIGAAQRPQRISDLATEFTGIPKLGRASTGTEILMSVVGSGINWVKCGEKLIASPSRIKRLTQKRDGMLQTAVQIEGLMVHYAEWIHMADDTELSRAREWVTSMRRNDIGGATKYGDDAILVTMEDGEVSGVLEVGKLMTIS